MDIIAGCRAKRVRRATISHKPTHLRAPHAEPTPTSLYNTHHEHLVQGGPTKMAHYFGGLDQSKTQLQGCCSGIEEGLYQASEEA